MGHVVASYFSPKSFQQRLNAGEKTIFNLPLTPVLIQHMVGTESIQNISTGCVVYSQEPAGQATGITTIQSTWGHPQAIVDNLLPVDTAYVTNNKFVHYVTRIKRKRLASNDKKLTKVKNPKNFIEQHSLCEQAILAIDSLTRKLVAHYDYPIDLELIVDTANQKIFVLQARPLIQTTKAAPSFVSNIKKISDLDKLPCCPISSNNGQAIKINSQKELLTAQTLEHALEIYNQKPNKTIQVVVVKEKAEQTSHAAATLRGEGVAIITCQDYEDFTFWLSNKQHNIIIDVQQGKIINNEHEQAIVKNGWLNYTLPLNFSITKKDISTHCLSNKSSTQIRKKIAQLKNFKHISKNNRILLKNLKKKITLLENNIEYALSAIEQTKYLPPTNLQGLFAHRYLEALVKQKSNTQIVNTISIRQLQKEKNDLVTFYNTMLKPLLKNKQLSQDFLENSTLLEYAQKGFQFAISNDIAQQWLMFLNQHGNKKLVRKLNELQQLKLFPAWLNMVFNADKSTQLTQNSDTRFTAINEIQEHLNHVDYARWMQPALVKQELKKFYSTVLHPLHTDKFKNIMQGKQDTKALEQFAALTLMQNVIETYDKLLKQIKASTAYATSRQKLAHFKKALKPFYKLLSLTGVSKDLNKQLFKVLNKHRVLKADLSTSPSFAVGALIATEQTGTKKETIKTIATLEDAFTTIHQVLLNKLGTLMSKSQAVGMITKPVLIQKLEKKLALSSNLIGIEFKKHTINFIYNKELREHSACVTLSYDNQKKDVIMSTEFFGENEYARWQILNDYVTLASLANNLPLTDCQNMPHYFSFDWHVKELKQINIIARHFKNVIQATYKLALEHEKTIYQTTQQVLAQLYDNLTKKPKCKKIVNDKLSKDLLNNDLFSTMLVPYCAQLKHTDKHVLKIIAQSLEHAQTIFEDHKEDNNDKLLLSYLLYDELHKKLSSSVKNLNTINFNNLYNQLDQAEEDDKETFEKHDQLMNQLFTTLQHSTKLLAHRP